VTTLAALALDLPRYDRSKSIPSGIVAPASWVHRPLVNLDLKGRAAWDPSGRSRRSHRAGLRAVRGDPRAVPCERLRVADRGLREGMLRELMGRD